MIRTPRAVYLERVVARGLATVLLASTVLLSACAHAPAEPATLATIDAIEARLLSAPVLHLQYHARASGFIAAELEGVLERTSDGRFDLTARGTFAGDPVNAEIHADAMHMIGGNTKRFDLPRAAALDQGVLVAIARLGLLHDLSMLADGSPPDFIDGTAQQKIVVDSQHDAGIEDHAGYRAHRIDFTLHVGSKADGILWVDAATGLPRERQLTVHFAHGNMQVDETYTWSETR